MELFLTKMRNPVLQVNSESLKLIVKSKNRPGSPIYREDLPRVLFDKAPRILLGKKWFDKYSEKFKSPCCQGCHKVLPLERHELYGLYQWGNIYVVKLEGIMNLCHNCHGKIHGGFSTRNNMKYGYVNDPVPVSDSMDTKKYPWNKAEYIWVEGSMYIL